MHIQRPFIGVYQCVRLDRVQAGFITGIKPVLDEGKRLKSAQKLMVVTGFMGVALLGGCSMGRSDAPVQTGNMVGYQRAIVVRDGEDPAAVLRAHQAKAQAATPLAQESSVNIRQQSGGGALLPSANAFEMVSNEQVQLYDVDDLGTAHYEPVFDAGVQASPAPAWDGGVLYGRGGEVTVYPLDVPPGLPDTGVMVGEMVSAHYAPPPTQMQSGQSVYFANGSANIDSEGRRTVAQAATIGRSGAPLRVEGHASARAASANPVDRHITNMRLSMKRAMNVSESLIREGVPPTQIRTTAHGDAQALQAGSEAAARRVDILTGY